MGVAYLVQSQVVPVSEGHFPHACKRRFLQHRILGVFALATRFCCVAQLHSRASTSSCKRLLDTLPARFEQYWQQLAMRTPWYLPCHDRLLFSHMAAHSNKIIGLATQTPDGLPVPLAACTPQAQFLS
jgi:hypothetical protein